uniref:Ig-like domain-containing protein n=1 Tax=Pygocentrus nattereri TaxID=42514 RepID=A0A3B4DYK2_PYGNA
PALSHFTSLSTSQKIMPLTEEVQVSEGDNVTLSCTYSSSSTNDALQWYRQFPRSTPEFLLYIYPQGGMTLIKSVICTWNVDDLKDATKNINTQTKNK